MTDLAALPLAEQPPRADRARPVAVWLLVVAAMIFAMTIIGALTRLTESGLSIVEWKPITGILPPLGAEAWQEEFAKYRQSPEYRLVNRGMSLEQFQGIFWLEYIHRLWGRLIGIAFAVPMFWFLIKRRVPPGVAPHLWLLLALGGAQGLIGWLMVQSGLVDRPSVSPYRLALHLGLAVAIYGYVVWLALGLLQRRSLAPRPPAGIARLFVFYVFLVIVSGAFVAGLDAGLVHNTFPDMSGHLFPPGGYDAALGLRNLFENPTVVQFQHRWLAKLAVLLAFFVWLRVRTGQRIGWSSRRAADLMLGMALLQLGLGVSTLLFGVPLAVATLHQGGALVLFTLAILLLHRLRSPN
ncbi:MAG: COX15/CtaA family protein [Reyranellaceae bacterium]